MNEPPFTAYADFSEHALPDINTPPAHERTVMLARMREASQAFYRMAVQTGCHPFIEFTGLMNEYILCCSEAHKQGIDFSACNQHQGQPLPMPPHSIDYVNEKLGCIFMGRSVLSHKDT